MEKENLENKNLAENDSLTEKDIVIEEKSATEEKNVTEENITEEKITDIEQDTTEANNLVENNIDNNIENIIENNIDNNNATKKESSKEIPRVLLVEDDETARLSLKVALEAENIFVEAVENGSNAENMIKYSAFDVVIVDYRLPDIDGLNLIKKMKIIVPDIMTLVVTAHSSVEIAVDALKMGAYDYMTKPLDIPNLVNTIYKILSDKKNLYDSRQKIAEMVSKRTINYLFNDEKVSIITAPNPNILVEGKSGGGIVSLIKNFFVGIKNYYWGA